MENVKKSTKTSIFQTRFNGENASGYSQTQTLDAINTNELTMINSDKTCQTCKHWGDDIERKTESLNTSTRECKEIFKRLTDCNDLEGYLPFFDSLATPATFGCNKYGKAKDGL